MLGQGTALRFYISAQPLRLSRCFSSLSTTLEQRTTPRARRRRHDRSHPSPAPHTTKLPLLSGTRPGLFGWCTEPARSNGTIAYLASYLVDDYLCLINLVSPCPIWEASLVGHCCSRSPLGNTPV